MKLINLRRVAVLGVIALAAAGCGEKEGADAPVAKVEAPTTPTASVDNAVRALRAGDLKALVTSQVPPKYMDRMRAEWKEDLAKDPPTEAEKKDFAEQMAKLTAPDAEAKMMAELEPQLVKFEQEIVPQMPMMIAFGQGMLQQGIKDSKDLTESQKLEAGKMLDGVAKWVQTVKFTDRAVAQQGVKIVVDAARAVNLKTLDEARALEFEQAMEKSSIVFRAAKDVLKLYGLDLDKALDTVKTEKVSETGDTAKVKVSFTMFDQPSSFETELVKVDGNWYGKQTIDELNKPDEPEETEEPMIEGDDGADAPAETEEEAAPDAEQEEAAE